MRIDSLGRIFSILILALIEFLPSSSLFAAQNANPFGQGLRVVAIQEEHAHEDEEHTHEDEEADKDETEEDADEEVGAVEAPRDAVEIDPQLVQLQLWDGSIIGGQLKIETLSIDTEFGPLEVPVAKIRKILPGLDSYPDLKSHLEELVATLSSKDFDQRDKAQRELIGMGVMLREQLSDWVIKGDAEQKKRLKEIIDQIQPMVDDLRQDGELSAERSLIYLDTIVTDSFTIVGKIQTKDYTLKTKFGDLSLTLSDVKVADRTVFMARSDLQKSFEVEGEMFFQRKPLNTKIRVREGDMISIDADGKVHWTNWNQFSSPDGLNGQGMYEGVMSGTLVARIGRSGKLIKVGSKAKFRASTSGILYLGIAMQDNYLNRNNSYRWAGEYDAKVTVKAALE